MFLIFGTAALAEPQIGAVVQKQFDGATGTRASATSSEELPYAQDVFSGEKVLTPEGGSTVLRFRDQTQLQVGANSSVVLDRFVYDPNAQAVNGSITLAKGIFRYVSGSAANDQGVQFTTPTATLSIRGTKFVVYVAGDGSTTVSVLDGAVDVKPCGGGDTVHTKAGQGVKVWPSCATSLALISMPSDPAVDGDYDVVGGDADTGKGQGDNNGKGLGSPHEHEQ
jgi:hypothetical protein